MALDVRPRAHPMSCAAGTRMFLTRVSTPLQPLSRNTTQPVTPHLTDWCVASADHWKLQAAQDARQARILGHAPLASHPVQRSNVPSMLDGQDSVQSMPEPGWLQDNSVADDTHHPPCHTHTHAHAREYAHQVPRHCSTSCLAWPVFAAAAAAGGARPDPPPGTSTALHPRPNGNGDRLHAV